MTSGGSALASRRHRSPKRGGSRCFVDELLCSDAGEQRERGEGERWVTGHEGALCLSSGVDKANPAT